MEIVDICCKTRLNHPIIGVKRDRVVVFFTLWYRNIQCKKKHLMKVHAYQDDGQCYKCCKLLCIFECINSSLRHSIVLFIFTLWQIVGKLAVAEKWIKDFLLLLLLSAFFPSFDLTFLYKKSFHYNSERYKFSCCQDQLAQRRETQSRLWSTPGLCNTLTHT